MRNFLIFGGLAIIAGIVLTVMGCQERGLAATASQEPEEISLKDLLARGPDGNPNIILKDFVPCDNYVYETKGSSWRKAWVPIVPGSAQGKGKDRGGRPDRIRAIIFSDSARNEDDLYQRCERTKLRALVCNRLMSLGSSELNLLEKSYPGTDFSKCLIIQEGREPAGTAKVVLMVGGGTGLTLAGLGLVGFGLFQWYQGNKPRKRKRRRVRDEEEHEEEEERPRRPLRRRPAEEDVEEPPPRRRRPQRRDDEE